MGPFVDDVVAMFLGGESGGGLNDKEPHKKGFSAHKKKLETKVGLIIQAQTNFELSPDEQNRPTCLLSLLVSLSRTLRVLINWGGVCFELTK